MSARPRFLPQAGRGNALGVGCYDPLLPRTHHLVSACWVHPDACSAGRRASRGEPEGELTLSSLPLFESKAGNTCSQALPVIGCSER